MDLNLSLAWSTEWVPAHPSLQRGGKSIKKMYNFFFGLPVCKFYPWSCWGESSQMVMCLLGRHDEVLVFGLQQSPMKASMEVCVCRSSTRHVDRIPEAGWFAAGLGWTGQYGSRLCERSQKNKNRTNKWNKDSPTKQSSVLFLFYFIFFKDLFIHYM